MGLRQAINPSTQYTLYGIWHRYIFVKITMLDDCSGQFLQKEGIPFCFVHKHLYEMIRQLCLLAGRVYDGYSILRC